MERAIPAGNVRKLQARVALPVDPGRSIAVKRDVHEFEVDTDARAFVEAFREVLIDAKSSFGLIRVRRPIERMGKDFEVGERFQGCFSIERAALSLLRNGRRRKLGQLVASLFSLPTAARLVTWVEDRLLSNYAQVEDIEMEPDLEKGECYSFRYVYLDGTPIAGRSTYNVEPLGQGRCRVTQIFEYQERNAIAVGTFQSFGLKFHDQVVCHQVYQAAARSGAKAVRSTIPRQYADLAGHVVDPVIREGS